MPAAKRAFEHIYIDSPRWDGAVISQPFLGVLDLIIVEEECFGGCWDAWEDEETH